jgi:hypothetical protein
LLAAFALEQLIERFGRVRFPHAVRNESAGGAPFFAHEALQERQGLLEGRDRLRIIHASFIDACPGAT